METAPAAVLASRKVLAMSFQGPVCLQFLDLSRVILSKGKLLKVYPSSEWQTLERQNLIRSSLIEHCKGENGFTVYKGVSGMCHLPVWLAEENMIRVGKTLTVHKFPMGVELIHSPYVASLNDSWLIRSSEVHSVIQMQIERPSYYSAEMRVGKTRGIWVREIGSLRVRKVTPEVRPTGLFIGRRETFVHMNDDRDGTARGIMINFFVSAVRDAALTTDIVSISPDLGDSSFGLEKAILLYYEELLTLRSHVCVEREIQTLDSTEEDLSCSN